jgi:hypothetical protein
MKINLKNMEIQQIFREPLISMLLMGKLLLMHL